MAIIIELPLISDEDVVAEIYNIETGAHVDSAYNLESALTYVQDCEHIAVAVADELWASGEVRYTLTQAQDAYNNERRLQEDCFGLENLEYAA